MIYCLKSVSALVRTKLVLVCIPFGWRFISTFEEFTGFISRFCKNETLFVKIGKRVLDLWIVDCLGPTGPKLVFRPQTTDLRFILIF